MTGIISIAYYIKKSYYIFWKSLEKNLLAGITTIYQHAILGSKNIKT